MEVLSQNEKLSLDLILFTILKLMIFMMDELIKKFPAQLKEAIEIGDNAKIREHQFEINKVMMCGMGGSGIGGAYVSDLIADECQVPFIINSSYILPSYVDKNTLLIISSYSGNTEETLSALQLALKTEAKIVCISSGGKVIQLSEKHHLDHILLPAGWPSPRACLGYSLVQQLFILKYLKLISGQIIDQIRIASDLITFEQDDIKSKAEKIASLLQSKIPVIYTVSRTESVAKRWRQQLNENSKTLCWHHVIPEMNHNELVGWKGKNEEIAIIFLRYKDDSKKVHLRLDLTKQIVGKLSSHVIEIFAKGQSLSEKMIYLTHLGDWVSWYLSQLNGMDASEIEVIDFLKSKLEKAEL